MRVFVLVFTRATQLLFLRSSAFVVHRCFHRVIFFFFGGGGIVACKGQYQFLPELSTENGVAVVNAYGSIIGDNEDHVDDSTTEVCSIEKLISPVLFASIDLN